MRKLLRSRLPQRLSNIVAPLDVESFARQLGAKHEVRSSGEGTTHRLLIPHLD